MRREIAVQLALTGAALLLLLVVIFLHQPTYVEEFPAGVSGTTPAEIAPNAGKGVKPSEAETVYRPPAPTSPETSYRPATRPRLARGETRYRR